MAIYCLLEVFSPSRRDLIFSSAKTFLTSDLRDRSHISFFDVNRALFVRFRHPNLQGVPQTVTYLARLILSENIIRKSIFKAFIAVMTYRLQDLCNICAIFVRFRT